MQSTDPTPTVPEAEYRRRLDHWRDRQARLDRRAAFLRRAEKVVLGLLILLALLSEREAAATKFFMIAVPALLGQVVSTWRKRCLHGSQLAGRAAEWYETRLACLQGGWAGRGPAGERFADEAHPCASPTRRTPAPSTSTCAAAAACSSASTWRGPAPAKRCSPVG
jgi:hypothetical protein